MREEIFYKRELHFLEEIKISCEVTKLSKDYKKFAFFHRIWKPENIVAAEVIVEGVWLDLNLRRAVAPPKVISTCLEGMPRPDQFEWW